MKNIKLIKSNLTAPAIISGCMRISSKSIQEISEFIMFCVENGVTYFDHADIYGGGECERKFGEALKNLSVKRDTIFLQSKCSIVPGVMYNMSKQYILDAVDGILRRLRCDYLDSLLLHRPDALVEPEEVAEAFDILKATGKVRHFGVSNHSPMQMELLKKYVTVPLEFNQLQLSLPSSNLIANGMEVNMETAGSLDRNGSVLDYCRLNDITIQAWSPLQYGFFEGPFVGNYEKFPELNAELEKLASKYSVTPTGIATAWILRHPANMQVIAGTTSIDRMREIINSADITITREEWYSLYLKAGHILP
ncbi:MAG: aldo/keto reductase [Paludibacteraceae bacterium]|nr:aldo/keto reductase [Paludibacteraceae bacterium]